MENEGSDVRADSQTAVRPFTTDIIERLLKEIASGNVCVYFLLLSHRRIVYLFSQRWSITLICVKV